MNHFMKQRKKIALVSGADDFGEIFNRKAIEISQNITDGLWSAHYLTENGEWIKGDYSMVPISAVTNLMIALPFRRIDTIEIVDWL